MTATDDLIEELNVRIDELEAALRNISTSKCYTGHADIQGIARIALGEHVTTTKERRMNELEDAIASQTVKMEAFARRRDHCSDQLRLAEEQVRAAEIKLRQLESLRENADG